MFTCNTWSTWSSAVIFEILASQLNRTARVSRNEAPSEQDANQVKIWFLSLPLVPFGNYKITESVDYEHGLIEQFSSDIYIKRLTKSPVTLKSFPLNCQKLVWYFSQNAQLCKSLLWVNFSSVQSIRSSCHFALAIHNIESSQVVFLVMWLTVHTNVNINLTFVNVDLISSNLSKIYQFID